MRNYFYLVLIVLAVSCQATHNLSDANYPYHYHAQKRILFRQGAVVSAHPLASQAGLTVLKKGGNAIDAAIATQWALAVVYPGAGNVGGGGFMVARLKNDETVALDYRETAPGLASRDMYRDDSGNVIAGKSLYGHLACGVPGTVAGLFDALRYARLPMKTLIQPAIDLAEGGFAITLAEAESLNAAHDDFIKYNSVPPVFVKAVPWKKGDVLIQKDLSKTLKRIRDLGPAGFYSGKTADLIVDEMSRGNGLISKDDLKNYRAKWRQPLKFTYRGYEIVSMPLPSSGGLLLNQMMKMIEPYPLNLMGFQCPASVQLMTEVERRAYADRAKYMGDPDYYKVPVKELTDETYLKNRMKDYSVRKAGSSLQTGAGPIAGYESEETTHISVVDDEGNAVAVTTTLNGGYGCRTVVGGAGFLLNNEMDDFSVKPGTPNMFGATGGRANAIAPGKRMLSSMTPTLVLCDKKPYLVLGTPGGTTIPTSVFQTILNIIDFGLTASQAVNKPKFHHQWLPDRIDIENGFDPETAKALQEMGYTLQARKPYSRTELIRILPDGTFEAIADHRGDDSAAGY